MNNSSDRVIISDLHVRAVIGIFPDERSRKQDLILQLELDTDVRRAARRDQIEDALDYKQITKRILKFVSNSEFQLLETLAEGVATLVLAEFDTPRLTLRVEKPGALRHARTVGIQITRAREQ